ncbi:MAG TPA: hypothetical protein VGI10_23310, partial [Polyangiaceae bacterium]|jgi:hypothetical protein
MHLVEKDPRSIELVILESPADFSSALAAQPPTADQNHLMARSPEESLRRFALRVFKRTRRVLRATRDVKRISYVFSDSEPHNTTLRFRLLSALSCMLGERGVLRLVGPAEATAQVFNCMDNVRSRLRAGTELEAQLSPTGWTVISTRRGSLPRCCDQDALGGAA